MNRIIESKSHDPARNLAVEEALLAGHRGGAVMLLWQNENTVVIGRNQNAWRECRAQLLTSEGGQLVRRSSGGGAVYHDLGNLNFSFIVDRADYDVRRQLSVLTRAAASFGLDAEIAGRNDVLLRPSGEKFSGSAFRVLEKACLHHGTILIGADIDRLSRYLAPSPQKLAAKGVASVRARVTNLQAHAPGLSVERMKAAMRAAFIAEYGPAADMDVGELDAETLETLKARYESWDWTYGKSPTFDLSLGTRFPWGGAELLLSLRHGRVEAARLYTDSMDEGLSAQIEKALAGAPCTGAAMAERLCGLCGPQARDIAAWLGALTI